MLHEEHNTKLTWQIINDTTGSKNPVTGAHNKKVSCILPTPSSYMVIDYHQLECKVTSVHIHCDPQAMYACETWTRTAMIARCLRAILGNSWRDYVTNEEVMRRAGMGRLQDIVTTWRRKMAGHVLRLHTERPGHTAMYWVPEDGRRMWGRAHVKEDVAESADW